MDDFQKVIDEMLGIPKHEEQVPQTSIEDLTEAELEIIIEQILKD